MLDLPREHDDQAAKRVSAGEHTIETGEGVKARQPDLRLVWQALDRVVDVAELEVLCEEQAVPAERPSDGETRLETTDARKPPAESRHQVAGFDFPVVRAAYRA